MPLLCVFYLFSHFEGVCFLRRRKGRERRVRIGNLSVLLVSTKINWKAAIFSVRLL